MMAGGGENPKVDLKTFWPDKDVEFMIEMLRATGRYEVVPLELENVSGPDEYCHEPATSTHSVAKVTQSQVNFLFSGILTERYPHLFRKGNLHS